MTILHAVRRSRRSMMVKRPRGRPVGWRKPGRKSETIMVRASPVMVAWLYAQSEEHGLSMSDLVRQAIERAMEQKP